MKSLKGGTEVRVAAVSRDVRGQLQSVSDDVIVINSGKGQEMLTRQEVTRVSVKGDSHRLGNTLMGAAVGAGAGIGLGYGVTHESGCTGSCASIFEPKSGVAVGAGGVGLGVVGALIGAVLPTGGWHQGYKNKK